MHLIDTKMVVKAWLLIKVRLTVICSCKEADLSNKNELSCLIIKWACLKAGFKPTQGNNPCIHYIFLIGLCTIYYCYC